MSGCPRHLSHVKLLDVSEESTLLCKLPDAEHQSGAGTQKSEKELQSPDALRKSVSFLRRVLALRGEGGWHRATVYGFLISFGEIPKGLSSIAH